MRIEMTKQAIRNIEKLPDRLGKKLQLWIKTVVRIGLAETRKISGYHDEPLQGTRFGQRSFRLNRSYRGIYKIQKNNESETLCILEITKHRY